MAGIERIEILGTSNYLKERKQIGDDAIPDLNSIYRNILPLAFNCSNVTVLKSVVNTFSCRAILDLSFNVKITSIPSI